MSILHEDQYTFLIITWSVLPTVKNVSDRSCKYNRNIEFYHFYWPTNALNCIKLKG